MFLHWRVNLADQNKQQPLKINICVTYHTVLSVWNKPLIDTCQHCSTNRANQALRSLANAGFQNRGVCLQAFPSFPSPSPHFHFLASVSFFARPKPRIPFFGLSLLRHQTETLAMQATVSRETDVFSPTARYFWLASFLAGGVTRMFGIPNQEKLLILLRSYSGNLILANPWLGTHLTLRWRKRRKWTHTKRLTPAGVRKLSFKEIRENQRTVVEGRLVVEIFLWLVDRLREKPNISHRAVWKHTSCHTDFAVDFTKGIGWAIMLVSLNTKAFRSLRNWSLGS